MNFGQYLIKKKYTCILDRVFFHINFRMNKGRQNMCVLTLFNMLFYVKMILIISLTFFIYFINQTQLKYITPELFDFKHWPKSYFVI